MNKIIKLFKRKHVLSVAFENQKNIFLLCFLVALFSTIFDYLFIVASYPFLHFLNYETELTSFKFIYDFSIELFDFEFTEKSFWTVVWITLAISSVSLKLLYVWCKSYSSNMFGYHIAQILMQKFASQSYESMRNLVKTQ